MGLFNTLIAQMECPRCHQTAEFNIEIRFGDTRHMNVYHLGDHNYWLEAKRPQNGNLDDEGYAECPICQKDFFVKVIVRNDIFIQVSPDTSKIPYIPD